MSVIDTVKEKVGLAEQKPKYECADCGHEFRSDADEGSYWFQCPECSSRELDRVED